LSLKSSGLALSRPRRGLLDFGVGGVSGAFAGLGFHGIQSSEITHRLHPFLNLLRERCERFIQPKSGLLLLSRVKAAVSPWAAFMDFYWEPDPLGEGTRISVFNKTFQVWCLQTGTFDLADTSNSNIIQKIKQEAPAGTGSKLPASAATPGAIVSNSNPAHCAPRWRADELPRG